MSQPEDTATKQVQVLEALVQHLGGSRNLRELAPFLLLHAVKQDGHAAFTQQRVSASLEKVINERCGGRALPLGDVYVTLTDSSQLQALSLVGLGRWARGAYAPAGCVGVSQRTALLVETMADLSQEAKVNYSDVVGQVLWKFRGSEPVRKSEFFLEVAEDLSWLVQKQDGEMELYAEMARSFFKEVTRDSGKRMSWRQWVKVGQIFQKHPLVGEAIAARDLDRLFYQETRRQMCGDKGHTIGKSGFLRVLTLLAEIAKTHPKVLFLTLGSHAESLSQERERADQ